MRFTAGSKSSRHALHRISTMAAFAILALSGCGELHLAGSRYVLDSISGEPLPAMSHEEDFFRYVELADTLVLTSRTRGHHAYQVRLEDKATGKEIITIAATTNLTYELTPPLRPGVLSTDIAITYECQQNAFCIEGPHLTGRIEGASLALRVRYRSPERLHVYNRR